MERRYLNIDKLGDEICKIKGGKFNNQIIYMNAEKKVQKDDEFPSVNKLFETYKSPSDDVTIQLMPKSKKRHVAYIFGPSGCGKSTFVSNYAKEYRRINSDAPIILFSEKPQDDILDNIDDLMRIPIDDELLNMNIDLKTFEEQDDPKMLVIFDDIDSLDKKYKKFVYSLISKYLNIGRKYNISVLITNHTPCLSGGEKDAQRSILNETHTITFFPATFDRYTDYLLTNYAGIKPNSSIMEEIQSSPSRHITIFKHHPRYIMTETMIKPLVYDKMKKIK